MYIFYPYESLLTILVPLIWSIGTYTVRSFTCFYCFYEPENFFPFWKVIEVILWSRDGGVHVGKMENVN